MRAGGRIWLFKPRVHFVHFVHFRAHKNSRLGPLPALSESAKMYFVKTYSSVGASCLLLLGYFVHLSSTCSDLWLVQPVRGVRDGKHVECWLSIKACSGGCDSEYGHGVHAYVDGQSPPHDHPNKDCSLEYYHCDVASTSTVLRNVWGCAECAHSNYTGCTTPVTLSSPWSITTTDAASCACTTTTTNPPGSPPACPF